MSKVLDRLRQHGRAGIAPLDARRLFLWLYCTSDVLPPDLRQEALTKEVLAEVFSTLAVEKIIEEPSDPELTSQRAWLRLVDGLLSGSISPDESFFERAQAYLAS